MDTHDTPAANAKENLTYLKVVFINGLHLLLKMEPDRASALLDEWQQATNEKRQILLRGLASEDDPDQDFNMESGKVLFMQRLGAVYAQAQYEAEQREAAKLRAQFAGVTAIGGNGSPRIHRS